MARPQKKPYNVTDAEKRDLIERDIPTNADEFMGLRDPLGPLAAALD